MESVPYNETHERLIESLADQSSLDPETRFQLAYYGALLLEANKRLNLTGAKDAAALLPHLLDSLAVVPYVRDSLVDIGSGGGLPGIPLAIACTARVTLVDSAAKKTAFLQRTIDRQKLDAIAVTGRAETLAFDPALRETFVTATARAVAVAPTVLEYAMPFLKIGGRAILQRGMLDEHERQATADAALVLGGKLIEELTLEGNRRLLIVEKERVTPLRFPRRAGIPAKRPLCL